MVVIEDVHWIDPTMLELIGSLLNVVADNRILMMLTSRDDYPADLAAHPNLMTRLTLDRLGRAGTEAMVDRLSCGQLPRESIDTIVARTDGVPLFVEELTKVFIEGGEISVPASLYDLLMARLDRLGPAKKVAQIGAVIGRDFSHDMISAVMPLPDERALAALDQLVDSGLIFRCGTPPRADYTFKHVLMQDAAYESLLRSEREKIHAQIATLLQDRFSAVVNTRPELLAYHQTEAGLTEKAIESWLKAGENASRRSANQESIRHLTKGLELIATQPATPLQRRNELRLQLSLGRAFIKTKGYAASDVERAYARARVLC